MTDETPDAMELEEQFGIPSISLPFENGERLVVALDARKVQREIRAVEARLSDLSARRR